MPAPYIPVLVFALLVVSFSVLTVFAFPLVRRASRRDAAELLPHEPSISRESDSGDRDFPRFYIAAMLFVIFAAATIFLFLWAIRYRTWLADRHGAFALVFMIVFLGILLVGYIWLYKKGALDWE
jgi:NADH-quinone oxidoreductase subunit A